jgi:hypothetical protein
MSLSIRSLALATAVAAAALFSSSQPLLRADAPALSDTVSLLGPVYRDEADGFEVNPPEGSRLLSKAGGDLLSFVNDDKQYGGNIALSTMLADKAHPDAHYPLDEMLTLAEQDLSTKARNVQILSTKKFTISNQPAGTFAATMDMPTNNNTTLPLIKQQLLVQTSPTQYQTLTFFAPQSSKEEAQRVFTAMVDSFRLLDRKEIATHRGEAVKVAKTFLATHTAEDLVAKLNKNSTLFRMLVNGKDVGYVQYDESVAARDGFKGILLQSHSRTFPPNGAIITASNESFWAFAKQDNGDAANYSMWSNNIHTYFPNLPANSLQARQLNNSRRELGTLQLESSLNTSDNGINETNHSYVLTVTPSGDQLDLTKGEDTQMKWSIPTNSTPLPKPLEMLWPRMVDLTKPTSMGFVVFNPGTSRMALRILTVDGPDTVSINGQPRKLIRLEDEIAPNVSSVWVDDAGQIQMMRSSDGTVMVPTTDAEMQQLWTARLAELK